MLPVFLLTKIVEAIGRSLGGVSVFALKIVDTISTEEAP